LSDDPQIVQQRAFAPQHQVLLEAVKRILQHRNLPPNTKYDRPLIVVVAKYDAWCGLIGGEPLETESALHPLEESLHALNLTAIETMSAKVRELMSEYAEEVVAAAEGFFPEVLYVPVSSMGHTPEQVKDTQYLGIRPRDVQPMWVEVPLLYALHYAKHGLVLAGKPKSAEAGVPTASPAPPPPRLWSYPPGHLDEDARKDTGT
jgi:hypothetical protein